MEAILLCLAPFLPWQQRKDYRISSIWQLRLSSEMYLFFLVGGKKWQELRWTTISSLFCIFGGFLGLFWFFLFCFFKLHFYSSLIYFIQKRAEITYLCLRAGEKWHPKKRNNVMLLKHKLYILQILGCYEWCHKSDSLRFCWVTFLTQILELQKCLETKQGCTVHKHLHS